MVNSSFWKNKKIFLTGHTGFKGSWLTLWLNSLGAKVVGYSLPAPTVPSLFEMAKIAEHCIHHIGDIRDYEKLSSTLKNSNAEIVLHLAAQPLVRLSYETPLATYATNVMGTANLLEAIRHAPAVRGAIVVTTDKCYENKEWHYGYREIDPIGGYDPYSSSKACAELVTAAYRSSFFNLNKHHEHGVVIASARAGNVIGGGDWAIDRLVPDIVNSYLNGKKVLIRNPHAIRPWQHVLEPLSGYLILAEKLFGTGFSPGYPSIYEASLSEGSVNGDGYEKRANFGEAYNFGPSDVDCQSVEILVEKITKIWGGKAQYDIDNSIQPHEASFLKLDSSRAHSKLGWWPRWNIDQAIEETVSWYQSICTQTDGKTIATVNTDTNGCIARELTLKQIEKFCNVDHISR